jgi:hypothetical protein
MDTKHTATPYWHSGNTIYQDSPKKTRKFERDCVKVAVCSFKSDAAFIVRACNAHDDLVDALQGLIALVHSPSSPVRSVALKASADAAGAALAKATGSAA